MELKVLSESERQAIEARKPDVDAKGLEAALRKHVEGSVRFDPAGRGLYATDASNYRQPPIGVVAPKTIDDVVATFDACRAFGAPILSRGGGTSLAGQCCNVAVVIDFTRHLNKLIDIDPAKRTARVQPGLVLDHLRDPAKKQYGLTFGPDPSTHAWCTLGGMIGNNACGVHSVMCGDDKARTSDHVEAMDVLLYDGTRMTVGPTTDAELADIISKGGRRADIYRSLRQLRDDYGQRVRERYPDIPRRVSGYNLDDLLPEKGFHVARALAGTEGTCVAMLEATVNLIPAPRATSLLVLGYPDVFAAGDHVPFIKQFDTIAIEGMDDLIIDFMRKQDIGEDSIKALPEGRGWLYVQFGGDTKQEADDKLRHCMAQLEKQPNPPTMRWFETPQLEQQIWRGREAGLGATAHVPNSPLAWSGWEDTAVHPDQLGDYLRDFRTLLEKYGYTASVYGHFGQACVHSRIPFDMQTRHGVEHFARFLEEGSDLVVKYKGSFSAEHGDGQSRAWFLEKMLGPELIEAHRQFKTLWDPDWKMNPGKVVEPNRPDTNLRLGDNWQPMPVKTHFAYASDDGDFHRAMLRCVGVGKCRKSEDTFMCPSYVATRDEQHTTRGRARLLFEMLGGEVITGGWKDDGVREALDLCLGCKGCKAQCPVDVDMATYKSEFLSHYYEGRLRPRAAYAMGMIDTWSRPASLMPGMANFFSQTPPFAGLAKWAAGVAPQRQLPRFARPFTRSFANRRDAPTPSGDSGRRTVLLLPDAFNNFFMPDTLHAAAELLDHLGYHVDVPARHVPATRPPIHFGMLDLAKSRLRQCIDILRPWFSQGLPIVCCEPSTVAVFRDELTELLPDNEDATRLASSCRTLSEFLGEQDTHLPAIGGQAVLHNHCHHKASLTTRGVKHLLEQLDITHTEPEAGCCGMAGAFGFEDKHYELSQTIGERNLFPAARNASPDTRLITEGFSCRIHVHQATGRMPEHIAQTLLDAVRRDRGSAHRPHSNS